MTSEPEVEEQEQNITEPISQEEPEKEESEPSEEESNQSQESSTPSATKSSSVVSSKIPVTEYGIKSGEFRCAHCARAYKFFQTPKIKRYFNYKYADLLLPRNRKVSEREGIDEMPFFKVKRPGSEKYEFIVGFNEVEWEEMIEEVKQR